MSRPTALFAGDIGLDLTALIQHPPAADEKVLATASLEDVGGVVSNASVACALAGAPARALVQVGPDAAGEQAVAALGQRGVEIAAGRAEGGATGRALILIDQTGEKRLVLVPGSSIYPSVEQVRAAPLDDVRWLHTALYDVEAAALLVERCRRAGIPWSIDLEPATLQDGLAAVAPCLAGAEVVLVNSRAAAVLGSDPTGRLHDLGVSNVVLTAGARGAEWCSRTHRAHVPAPVAPGAIVDTTGAGDALAGWLVARLLLGDPPAEALREAVAAATLSCAAAGAQRSYPRRTVVLDALSGRFPIPTSDKRL